LLLATFARQRVDIRWIPRPIDRPTVLEPRTRSRERPTKLYSWKKNQYYRLATLQEYATSIVWTLERLSLSQFPSSSLTHQWYALFSDSGGVMGGKWSPQVGKFGGTGGRSACVPTCRIRFMPISMWNKKWQWNNQYPTKKIDWLISANNIKIAILTKLFFSNKN